MKKNGFSLVELSIVLVILGLLTGGILTGQSLIRAAELRAAVSQYQNFHSAVMTFRGKYFALPGDMRNATDFWGIAAGSTGSDTTCYAVVSTDKTTCNGSGDGFLFWPPGVTGGVHAASEQFRAWQHLANAGLIEGSYTGKTDSTTSANIRTPGLNTPPSKISNGVVSLPEITNTNPSYFTGVSYGINAYEMGGVNPQENWGIDKKMDDGSPVYGKVFGPRSDATWAVGCTTATDLTAEYNLDDESGDCTLLIRMQ